MKHNKAALYALCALAALGAAAAILLSGADIARVLLCYPLEFTGKALRSLSLAGGALNVLAIALYAAISLIPAVLALIFALKRGHAKADCILYILSVVLFAALYLAINPGLLRYVFSADMLAIVASYQVALGILNSLIYSLVLCYAVLRIISRLALDGTDRLLSAGAWLLYIACAVLSFASAYGAACRCGLACLRCARYFCEHSPRRRGYAAQCVQHIARTLRGKAAPFHARRSFQRRSRGHCAAAESSCRYQPESIRNKQRRVQRRADYACGRTEQRERFRKHPLCRCAFRPARAHIQPLHCRIQAH